MIIIWTLVLVLATEPNVQMSLIAEFRTEADCKAAVKFAKLEPEEKAGLKCMAFAYEGI